MVTYTCLNDMCYLHMFNPLSAGTDFEGLCKQFGSRWDATERGGSSGSKLFAILIVKNEENANFRNSADDILADNKLPSMQRVKVIYIILVILNKNVLTCK